MTDETIVAVYDSSADAALAVQDLEAAGVPSRAISQHTESGQTTNTTTTTAAPVREQGFWANVFGGEPAYEHDAAVYDHSLKSGSTVVTVKASEQHLTQIIDVLERHNPIDIDERASSYDLAASSGATKVTSPTAATASPPIASGRDTTGPQDGEEVVPLAEEHLTGSTASPTVASGRDTTGPQGGEEVVPLAEEQLTVDKRLVNRGTTRIRRFVVETPVEEAVTLHSERVSIDRRPVTAGTQVSDTAFTDRTVEVTESDEEAVVSKTARVKEEVVVNKAVTDRVETVRDTVRREDVEVTRDGQATESSSTAAPSPQNPRPGV